MKTTIKTITFLSLFAHMAQAMNPYEFKCMGCHGENGERAALGRTKPIGGMNKVEMLQKMRSYRNGELNTYGFGGLMRQQIFKLKEREYEEIAEYVSKMRVGNE